MGSSVERFLQGDPQGSPSRPTSEVERFLTDDDTTRRLGQSRDAAAGRDPGMAARVLRLGAKTGLPKDLIERNLDQLEAEARRSDFDPGKYRQTSPVVAKWLAEHPDHFAAARNDLTKLSYLERQLGNIGAQFREGVHLTELKDIGEAAILGRVTPEQRRRQAALDQQMGRAQEEYGLTGFWEGIPGAVANQLPIMGQTLLGKVKGAASGAWAGAAVGGAAAAIGGQLGPQIATPEELVTVPGAAAAVGLRGAAIGWRYGAGVEAGRMEAALAYLEFEKIRDEQGRPLDRQTMLGAAAMVGVVNGSLEALGFESMAKTIPGLRALGRPALAKALAQQTTRRAVQRFAQGVASSMATEGITEAMQSLVTNGAGELALMATNGDLERLSTGAILDRLFSDEFVQQAMQEGRAGAQGGGGMSIAGGSASMAIDVRRAKQAQANAQAFIDIGNGVKESEMFAQLPDALRTVVERVAEDGDARHVYTPIETWNEYWQSQDIDPAEVAAEVTGSPTAYAEALQTGGDLVIPTERYATTLAASDHNLFFAKELRASATAMNQREAETMLKGMDELDREGQQGQVMTDRPAEEVGASVQAQLEAAGFDPETAGTYATLYESTFRTLGARTGMDPAELFKRYNLSIDRSSETNVQPAADAMAQDVDPTQPGRRQIGNDPLGVFEGTVEDVEAELERVKAIHAPLSKEHSRLYDTQGEAASRTVRGEMFKYGSQITALQRQLKVMKSGMPVEELQRYQAMSDDELLQEVVKRNTRQRSWDDTAETLDKNAAEAFQLMGEMEARRQRKPLRQMIDKMLTQADQFSWAAQQLRETVQQDDDAAEPTPLVGQTYQTLLSAGIRLTDFAMLLEDGKTLSEAEYKEMQYLMAMPFTTKAITDAADEFEQAPKLEFIATPLPDNDVAKEAWAVEVGNNGDDGQLTAFRLEDRVQIAGALLRYSVQGQGLGIAMYEVLLERAFSQGLRVFSDSSVSADARRVYAALERRGYGVRVVPDEEQGDLPRGTPEFEVTPQPKSFDQKRLSSTGRPALAAEGLDDDLDAILAGLAPRPEPAVSARDLQFDPTRLQAQATPQAADPTVERARFLQQRLELQEEHARVRKQLESTVLTPDMRLTLEAADDAIAQTIKWLTDRFGFLAQTFDQSPQAHRSIVPGMHSKLESLVLQRFTGARAAKAQVAALQKDLKPDEWLWYGMDTFLESQGASIETSELMAHLAASRLVVEEAGVEQPLDAVQTIDNHRLNEYTNEEIDMQAEMEFHEMHPDWDIHQSQGSRDAYDEIRNAIMEDPQRMDEIREAAMAMYVDMNENDTEGGGGVYRQYTIPGGTQYREILFRLPGNSFQSTHWTPQGVFAHLRVTERTDEQGRQILMVEEIQSDLHQKGRKKGYFTAEDQLKVTELSAAYEAVSTEYLELIDDPRRKRLRRLEDTQASRNLTMDEENEYDVIAETLEGETRLKEILKQRSAIIKQLEVLNKKVADAPFKKTWHEFVMKRVLKMAVEEGYDGVGIAPGAWPNDYYNLTQHVIALEFAPSKGEPGAGVLTAIGPSGLVAFRERMREDEVSDYVGEKAAKALFDMPMVSSRDQDGFGSGDDEVDMDPVYALEGEDLELTQDDLRPFYDVILPNFLRKFLRKFDGELTTTNIEIPSRTGKQEQSGLVREGQWKPTVDGERRAFETTVNYIPIHNNVKLKAAATTDAFELFQNPSDPRGRIRIGDASVNIELFKSADLSTFLHETGHFYMAVLEDLALGPDATPDVSKDYEAVRRWLKVPDGELMTRAQHERFARGFEAYLMSGKAPTSQLRQAFARFRAWLVGVYKSVAQLNVGDLSPEITGVFDRLLASDAELAAAQGEQGNQPMFADPAAAGMTAQQAADYAAAVTDARLAAEEALTSRAMQELRREQTRLYKQTRAGVRQVVADEVNQDPTYLALGILQHGTLPDGGDLPEGFGAVKLSKAAILEDYGHLSAGGEREGEFLKRLPRPHVYAKSDGLHPEQVAELVGFNSGDELLRALFAVSETATARIERITNERMAAEYPNMVTDGRMPAEAVKALHSDKRAELLRKELQHLASNNLPTLKGLLRKVTRRIPPQQAIRDEAERIVAAKAVRDVSPIVYQRSEAKAARLALEAMLRGDVEQAFDEKQRELLAHELYRAAVQAREEVDAVVTLMAKFNKATTRTRLAKAGGDYLLQIDALRERYSFTKNVSMQALDQRESLLAWVRKQEAEGLVVSVPESVLNEARRQSYKTLTIEELRGIRDTVKQIQHLAGLKNKLLANKKARSVAQAVAAILGSINAHHTLADEPPDFAPGLKERLGASLRALGAAHTKMEFLFEWLDGHKPGGPVWQHLFKPIADAENTEALMRKDAADRMATIFQQYPRKERATWFWKRITVPGVPGRFTKANLLAVALNVGNEYNKDALLRGYQWTDQQLDALLATLDQRDWGVVQQTWDFLDSYWPQIASLEKDLNGLPPAKVQATPVTTPFGELRGGYYPVVFDSKLSWRQASLDARAAVRDLFGGNWARAMTRHGHTEERTNTGGKPILLDLSGLTSHTANVIHDVTHRRAVLDVNKLIQLPEVRTAVEQSVGREYYRQIHPWLTHVAADRPGDAINPIEGMLARARTGATVVNMGWKLTTAMAQPLGYTISAKELGAKYAMRGVTEAFGRPGALSKTFAFVVERSPFMQERLGSYDRDVRDALRKLNVVGANVGPLSIINTYTADLTSSWFMLTGWMDMAVSLPTWLGAYYKAYDGKLDNITKADEQAAADYADQLVRQTQGVGAAKDLASVQRGPEAYKLFTMFYSYFSVLFNQFAKTQRQQNMEPNLPKYVAALALLWFVPSVLGELVVGRGPDDDDDDMEGWMKWLAKTEFKYPFQSIVLVRDIVNGMGEFGYEPSAAFDAFESLANTGKAIGKAISDDEEVTRTDVRAVTNTVGYFGKLPTRQVFLTLDYFYAWLTGELEPANPITGLWNGFVTGRPRD